MQLYDLEYCHSLSSCLQADKSCLTCLQLTKTLSETLGNICPGKYV